MGKITVEQKDLEIGTTFITEELEKFYKNSDSIFTVISISDTDDILKAHNLFGKINYVVLRDKEKFLMNSKANNGYLFKDNEGWRLQSHYLGSGMNTHDLEKCINYIIENKLYIESDKDYTKDMIASRIEELIKGREAYIYNDSLINSAFTLKGSYSTEGHNFWKNSDIIINELKRFL